MLQGQASTSRNNDPSEAVGHSAIDIMVSYPSGWGVV